MKNDLSVTVNTDNTITIDWDETDPKWSFLNDLTEEEFKDLLMKGIEKLLNESND